MGEREEACVRLLDVIEDVIASLERGKEECALDNWEFFAPEDLEEIIENLREIASKLNLQVTRMEDFDIEE